MPERVPVTGRLAQRDFSLVTPSRDLSCDSPSPVRWGASSDGRGGIGQDEDLTDSGRLGVSTTQLQQQDRGVYLTWVAGKGFGFCRLLVCFWP
jgi:hypothetical protein